MLYPKDKIILQHIARGRTYAEIAQAFHMTLDNVYSHCANIRRETGIKNTANVQECKDYLYGHAKELKLNGVTLPRRHGPSQAQLRVMTLYGQGMTHKQIGEQLSIKPQTVNNHLTCGCAVAPLELTKYSRREAVRRYLANLLVPASPITMDDPFFN